MKLFRFRTVTVNSLGILGFTKYMIMLSDQCDLNWDCLEYLLFYYILPFPGLSYSLLVILWSSGRKTMETRREALRGNFSKEYSTISP